MFAYLIFIVVFVDRLKNIRVIKSLRVCSVYPLDDKMRCDHFEFLKYLANAE